MENQKKSQENIKNEQNISNLAEIYFSVRYKAFITVKEKEETIWKISLPCISSIRSFNFTNHLILPVQVLQKFQLITLSEALNWSYIIENVWEKHKEYLTWGDMNINLWVKDVKSNFQNL